MRHSGGSGPPPDAPLTSLPPAGAAEGLEIRFEDEGLSVAVLPNVVIAVWRENPTMERIAAFWNARAGMSDYVFVNVMGTHTEMPLFSEEVRAELKRKFEAKSGRIAIAHVVQMPGFQAAAVRAFLSAGNLWSPTPSRVFKSKDGAAEWVHGRVLEVGSTTTRAAIRRALDLRE